MFKDALATLGLGMGLFGFPGAPSLAFEERAIGTGANLEFGQRVTVHFLIADEAGTELANSRRRGLPFTFLYQEKSDEFLGRWLNGMRVGGQRRIRVPAEQAFGGSGLPPIVPANTPVVVVVTVVKASAR